EGREEKEIEDDDDGVEFENGMDIEEIGRENKVTEDEKTSDKSQRRNRRLDQDDNDQSECLTQTGPSFFIDAIKNMGVSFDSNLIHFPTFIQPLPKQKKVIYCDHEGNYAAIVEITGRTVTLLSPSNNVKYLAFLAAFTTTAKKGELVKVQFLTSQIFTGNDNHLPNLLILLGGLKNELDLKITQFPPSSKSPTFIESYVKTGKKCKAHPVRKSTSFELFCCCNRPFDAKISSDAA
ncbi:hypothetical protein PFISCL1PPCAC_25977, partial [Pristionchus fissidentatus]